LRRVNILTQVNIPTQDVKALRNQRGEVGFSTEEIDFGDPSDPESDQASDRVGDLALDRLDHRLALFGMRLDSLRKATDARFTAVLEAIRALGKQP
jgi:hypothetical protein